MIKYLLILIPNLPIFQISQRSMIRIFLLLLISSQAYSQTAKYATKHTTDEYWALAKDSVTWLQGKGYQILHLEATDTATYVWTIYKRKLYTSTAQPVTIQALNYLTMRGIVRSTDYIGSTDNTDYVQYPFIQSGKFNITATFSRGETNPTQGKAEVRSGSATGAIIGTLAFRNTGGWGTIVTEKVGEITVPSGTTSIFIIFTTASGNGNIRSFMLVP